MIENISNKSTLNNQYANPYLNQNTNTGVQTQNSLERQPKTDNIELQDNQPLPNEARSKSLLKGLATAMLKSILYPNNPKKELEKIERKFLRLQKNLPEVQKTFKRVFLRKNLTEEEALEMLNRYKEVEKIQVTGTKEEYIQAVFNEAKRNFGFTDSKINIEFIKGQASKSGKTQGRAGILCNRVEIDPNTKINQIQGIIHHEIRHLKQNFYAVNYDPQTYKYALLRDNNFAKNLSPEELEEVLDDCLKHIKESFNLESFSTDNIPNEHLQYAKACLEASTTYVNGHNNFKAYYDNFKEADARYAGGLIDKLFNGIVLGGNR